MSQEVVTNEEVVEEVVSTEEVANTENDVKLESDKANEEASKPTLEDLEAKLQQQEEYIKKLKDEKSQTKEAEIKQEQAQTQEQEKSTFMQEALKEAMLNGKYSDDIVTKAEEYGISSDQLELMQLKAEKAQNQIFDMAGGKEQYHQMTETVKEHVSEQDVAKFQRLLSDPDTADIALMALKQKYAEVSGSQGNTSNDRRITSDVSNTSTTGRGYKDINEYYKDMEAMRKLPKMQQGKYHAEIQKKLDRSNLV